MPNNATTTFDAVIAADWSAAIGRKPNPCEDRCWLSWAQREQAPTERPDPLYQPTRLEAEAKIRDLLTNEFAGSRVLVGLDFAIGYPLAGDGQPALPVGRALCAFLAERITDDPSGVNNRFDAADRLNQDLIAQLNTTEGPFWGRPKEQAHLHLLPVGRPKGDTRFPQFRTCERAAQRLTKTRPQSPFKLAGIGSVGSQSLVGLPMLHRLLTDADLSERAHVWPFEPAPDRADAITFAEIYPSLYPQFAPPHWYKDARQVTDTRDALLAGAIDLTTPEIAQHEGWILGVPAD